MADADERPEVVVAPGAQLGECPVWDARSNRLVWVDVLGSRVHQTDVRSGASELIPTPSHVGAVAPRASGGFVAALQDGFWVIGMGSAELITRVPEARPDLRFNDGKCDPAGRFWAGTMAYDETPGAGALYRLDPDGAVTRMLEGVTISNGLAWSLDGRTMYFIDSPTRQIEAFSFVLETGQITDRRPAIRIPAEAGFPDGMTIDAEGGLWVALWGGGAVHRYFDGRLDRVIRFPVARPTSCTFGGDDLGDLFVTSASGWPADEEEEEEPLSGAVFRVRPGFRGLPPAIFSG